MNKGIYLVMSLAVGLVACGNSSLTPLSTEAVAEAKSNSPAQRAESVRIPAGTVVRVRTEQSLNTERTRAGERFQASLVSPVTIDGKEVLPKNTVFEGHVVTSADSGRLKGRAVIAITLDSFALNGKTYHIDTSNDSRVSTSHKKRNLGFIGGGAGAGALLGGIFGGGKGALIGAGAGAAAGTATAAATGKKHVGIPAETVLSFKLKDSVSIS